MSTAHQVMTMREARMRHLARRDGGRDLVGILTDRDLRRAAASDAPPMAEHEWRSLLDTLYVRDIMTPEVVTVHGTTPVADAAQIFLQHRSAVCPWCATTTRLKAC